MSRNTEGRTSWRRGVAVGLLGGAFLIGGCGGSDNSDATASSGTDYYPLSVGDRLVYVNDTTGLALRYLTSGKASVRGKDATFVTVSGMTQFPSDGTRFYLSLQGSALQALAPPDSDAFKLAIGDVDLLHFPPQAGASFIAIDKTLNEPVDEDKDGKVDTTALWREVKVLGFETINTPAGSFSNSAHVRRTQRETVTLSSTGPQPTRFTTIDDWYAPGIGLVKWSTKYGTSDPQTFTLAQYVVSGRRSHTTGPEVIEITPLPGDLQGRSATVTITFDRGLDPATVLPYRPVSLYNNAGVAYAGQVSYDYKKIILTAPVSSWSPGTYTVMFYGGITDLIGNPLPAQSHTFTISAGG